MGKLAKTNFDKKAGEAGFKTSMNDAVKLGKGLSVAEVSKAVVSKVTAIDKDEKDLVKDIGGTTYGTTKPSGAATDASTTETSAAAPIAVGTSAALLIVASLF